MKIAAVSDHFMEESFYRRCFSDYPELEVTGIPYFGARTRRGMRAIADKIEKGGPYAVPLPDDIYEAVAGADLLMVHLCPVTRQVLDAAPRLKYVLTNRGGLENIDLAAVKERNIPVLYNPAHNSNAVAELTICLMIAETRNVARSHHALKNGIWREEYPNFDRVFELRNKTVGLVGFGNIGRRVAEKLQPFHVRIMATDPNVSPDDEDIARFHVELTDLHNLLKESDIVSLHARTDDRNVIIGREEFDLMKPTATFINTARAYMVDYDYLAKILKENRISGAALEVFPEEPLPADSPFPALDNVTLTNHRGGDTVNCYSDSPKDLLDALFAYIREGRRPKFIKD
ncbi:MAG: 2-hydroxyacid dehydrogenase [Clostridiales bacterium]|nr:2-hydroxyacid dehydrogenase [Clostridiales bacterium]HOA84878.1 2-hydroxyacid dehydrogenase [Bacillota bacterium]